MEPQASLWTHAEVQQQRFLHKDVADGRLIFDRETCETRLLSPLAQFLIEAFEGRPAPLSTAEMVSAVQAEEPEAAFEECLEQVQEALAALAAAGLLKAVSA